VYAIIRAGAETTCPRCWAAIDEGFDVVDEALVDSAEALLESVTERVSVAE
jgi:hypothetical protein